MSTIRKRRLLLPLAVAATVGFALTACTGDIADEQAGDTDCADYEEYGTYDGASVTIGATIVDIEADRLVESWTDFSNCTGIEIDYQGSQEFEAQIAVLAEGGNAPDIGFVPQPGLVQRLAEGGWLIPASADVEANADEWWTEDWKAYGTVDDVFYGAPLMSNVKGYVWYSPAEFEENGWEIPATLDELRDLSDEIAAAGLVSSGDRGHYDRFRGRLVWPIRDITGQTVGFGARRLLDDDKGPKYLNTPETPVYHKAQVLYGLDLAKRDISRGRRVVVVEGYTDVMACHLAGVTTAVATCGTAFGPDHITVLRRVLGDDSGLGEVIFTFDPDAAGQKAAMRAFGEEKRFAAQTFVAVAPEGLDPCDLRIQRGDGAVRGLIERKTPMFEFVIRHTLDQYDLETVEGRVAALRAAAPVVAEIRDPSLRPGYARELARMLGTDLGEVQRAVQAAGRGGGARQAPGRESRGGAEGEPEASVAPAERPYSIADLPPDPATRLERDALQALLQHPDQVGEQLLRQAVDCRFGNQALAVVRDGVSAAFASGGTRELVARVVTEVPPTFAGLVHQLAVAPIPERSERELAAYVSGVVTSLVDRELLRQKAELLGRLQRTDAADRDAYASVQRALVAVEADRRSLRQD